MNKIKEFFWLCSGIELARLKPISTEHVKYASIGATVFFTGVLASISGGYAIHTVFENLWITIPFAILWGMIIFNLDRYIVSSLIKPKASGKGTIIDFFRELPPAIPRFLLAAVIAIAVSKPIELRLFNKEINAQIAQDIEKFKVDYSANSSYKKEAARLNQELKSDKVYQDLVKVETQIIGLKNDYVKEVQGLNGTKKYGYGIAAKTIEKTIQTLTNEADSLKQRLSTKNVELASKLSQLDSLHKASFDEELTRMKDQPGFLTQSMALEKLKSTNSHVFYTSLFITLLFLLLEISPLLVKLLSQKGIYDYQIEQILAESKSKNTIFHADLDTKIFEKEYLVDQIRQKVQTDQATSLAEDMMKQQSAYKDYVSAKLQTIQDIEVQTNSLPLFSLSRIKTLFSDQAEKTIGDVLDQIDEDNFTSKKK